MIREGQYIHVVFRDRNGSTVFFTRAERIDWVGGKVWTGKWWVDLNRCEPA